MAYCCKAPRPDYNDLMDFSFRSAVTIEKSDDPVLKAILEDCEINVEVTIHCRSHWDDLDFMTLDLEKVEFDPPDSIGAVKAQTLMHPGLMDSIHIEAEDKVSSRWGDYYSEAAEELQSLHDAAMDAKYDAYKERGF